MHKDALLTEECDQFCKHTRSFKLTVSNKHNLVSPQSTLRGSTLCKRIKWTISVLLGSYIKYIIY